MNKIKEKLTDFIYDETRLDEEDSAWIADKILSEFDVKEKQPDQIADEEKEKSWVGEFAPNGGHDPHNPFPLKPSVQECEHKNSSYDVTTGWRCEDCKTLSWFKPKEKSNLLKPKTKFEIEELGCQCECHQLPIQKRIGMVCLKCGDNHPDPEPFEIEELQLWQNEGTTDRDDENTRDIQDKINQLIKYLREHHELIK